MCKILAKEAVFKHSYCCFIYYLPRIFFRTNTATSVFMEFYNIYCVLFLNTSGHLFPKYVTETAFIFHHFRTEQRKKRVVEKGVVSWSCSTENLFWTFEKIFRQYLWWDLSLIEKQLFEDVLKNFVKFIGKRQCRSLFLHKFASLRPAIRAVSREFGDRYTDLDAQKISSPPKNEKVWLCLKYISVHLMDFNSS